MEEKFPSYDYQCKDAKFIVTTLPNEGFGATIRPTAVMYVLIGLATDRIPIFVANLSSLNDDDDEDDIKEKQFLKEPWNLASCPRKDMQCIFLPTTPCTVATDESPETVA